MDGGLDPHGRASKSPAYADYDPAELKKRLSRNTHVDGDNQWWGYNKRASTPPRMPSPRDRAEKGRHYKSQIASTIFPSEQRFDTTSTFETMRADMYLDRSLMKSRLAGARSRPAFSGDPGPLSLEMESCSSPYKGGRIPL